MAAQDIIIALVWGLGRLVFSLQNYKITELRLSTVWCTIQTVILCQNKSLGEESGKDDKGNCITISCFFGAQKNTGTLSEYLGETVLKFLTNQFLMTLPFSYLWQNNRCKKLEDKARRKFYKDKKDHDRRKMGTMYSNCKI